MSKSCLSWSKTALSVQTRLKQMTSPPQPWQSTHTFGDKAAVQASNQS